MEAAQAALKGGVQVSAVPQLFPTPEALAERMVALAQIQPGDKVLEPSAGTGRLLDAVLRVPLFASDMQSALVAIELNRDLEYVLAQRYMTLRMPRCTVQNADFLSLCPIDYAPFDVVLMNPPFANGVDVQHVTHALRFLRPGGRLVAIMSAGVTFRTDRKTVEFRKLVASYGGTIEELPANTFQEEGTGVQTVLVHITIPL
jgi:phospholipid N-methyltransferase